MKKIIKLMFLSLVLISCEGKDVENVTIKGAVFNKQTDKPIKNGKLEIEIECWKYGNSPDESYNEHEIKFVKIDAEGEYSVSFNKGAFVTFRVGTNENGGYRRNVSSLYVKESKNIHDIYLIPVH